MQTFENDYSFRFFVLPFFFQEKHKIKIKSGSKQHFLLMKAEGTSTAT